MTGSWHAFANGASPGSTATPETASTVCSAPCSARRKTADAIEFIQVRHEEMAAFMASGHAKFTGELGVCLATGGPGATHLLTGLYDAKLDHVPVLAIAGQAESTARGASYQQELEPGSCVFGCCRVRSGSRQIQPGAASHRPCHPASPSRRMPCRFWSCRRMCRTSPGRSRPQPMGFTRSGPGYARPRVIPHELYLVEAARILNQGNRVAILVGAGRKRRGRGTDSGRNPARCGLSRRRCSARTCCPMICRS